MAKAESRPKRYHVWDPSGLTLCRLHRHSESKPVDPTKHPEVKPCGPCIIAAMTYLWSARHMPGIPDQTPVEAAAELAERSDFHKSFKDPSLAVIADRFFDQDWNFLVEEEHPDDDQHPKTPIGA